MYCNEEASQYEALFHAHHERLQGVLFGWFTVALQESQGFCVLLCLFTFVLQSLHLVSDPFLHRSTEFFPYEKRRRIHSLLLSFGAKIFNKFQMSRCNVVWVRKQSFHMSLHLVSDSFLHGSTYFFPYDERRRIHSLHLSFGAKISNKCQMSRWNVVWVRKQSWFSSLPLAQSQT